MKQNNRGISMLLVMAALVVVGFVGTALIKLGTSDRLGGVIYKQSELARETAKSGITAAVNQLTVDNAIDPAAVTSILAKLNGYMALQQPKPMGVDSAICFMAGSPTTWANLTTDGSQQYRVYIDAFEMVGTECKIALVSEGRVRGGGKASALGVYDLSGLSIQPTTDWSDLNAIYFEDGVTINFLAPIHVVGDVYLSANCDFDADASMSQFEGKFRTQTISNPDLPMQFRGEYFFEGNSYFGKMPVLQCASAVRGGTTTYNGIANGPDTGLFSFSENVGFRHGMWLNTGINDDIPCYVNSLQQSYWLGWLEGQELSQLQRTYVDLNGKDIIHNDGFDYNMDIMKNKGASLLDNSLSEADVLTDLGFVVNPCELLIHPEIILGNPSNYTLLNPGGNPTHSLTTTEINNLPATWNGFAVAVCNNRIDVIQDDTQDITNNVIIIVPTSSTLSPSSVPGKAGRISDVRVVKDGSGKVDPSQSGHVTIINTGGSVLEWGGADTYRGLLYHQSGQTTIGGANNAGADGIYGALYGTPNGGYTWHPQRLDRATARKGKIIFDPTVFDQLATLYEVDADGDTTFFIEKTGCDDAGNNSAGQLTANKIDPSFLSQAF